jgi:hydrogenase maturation factor
MCLTLTGKVVDVDGKKAVVDVNNRKIHAKINPSVSVNKGDKVIIFRDMILEKVTK